jgi:hypothetical protein
MGNTVMKVKRIGTLQTFNKYKEHIKKLVPRYLNKSKCTDTNEVILSMIELGCNDPFFVCCVIEDGDKTIGFLIAYVHYSIGKKKIIIDHFHCPNAVNANVYKMVTEKMCKQFNVKSDDVYFLTYRNPDAWVRLSKKRNLEMEVHGWILKRKNSEGE